MSAVHESVLAAYCMTMAHLVAVAGQAGVKGGDWYLAIVGCCRAAGDWIMIHPARAQSTSPAVLLLKISRSLKTMTCSPELPRKGGATADLCWKCRRIAHHYYPFHCDTQLKKLPISFTRGTPVGEEEMA